MWWKTSSGRQGRYTPWGRAYGIPLPKGGNIMYGKGPSRTDSSKKSTDALAAYHFNKKAQSCRCLLHCFCHIDILLHRHFCPTKETILMAHFVNRVFFNWPCWQVTLEKKLNWALKTCQVPQCKLVILNFKISNNMLLIRCFGFAKNICLWLLPYLTVGKWWIDDNDTTLWFTNETCLISH